MRIRATRPRWPYYAALLFVVFFWGCSSIIYSSLYKYYSASVLSAIMTFFSFLFFLFLSRKRFAKFDARYLKFGLPACLLSSFAGVMQRIGLQYTTPAHYAFLEHIACVVVPIAVFLLVRKKPSISQSISVVICLIGCFIISGADFSSAINGGDILCFFAGILYGVSSALIGTYAKELDTVLFMLMYTFFYFLVSLGLALTMDNILINGVPMEKASYSLYLPLLLAVMVIGVVDIGICWFLKNLAVQRIDPTTVATISPFSAVIAGSLSVVLQIEQISPRLVIAGVLIMFATLLPEFPALLQKKHKRTDTA